MTPVLRPNRPEDAPALSALCMRSKAYWGYDDAFMEACRDELTVTPDEALIVAEQGGTFAGLAQVEIDGTMADLDRLFIDPPFIGTGLGRVLFDWCVAEARRQGAKVMTIEADPGAAGFYEAMGARRVGETPSASIPGRALPLLEFDLR